MTTLIYYQHKYEDYLRLERRDGVLQATLHTDDGLFILSRAADTGLGSAWLDIAADPDNKVLILTWHR